MFVVEDMFRFCNLLVSRISRNAKAFYLGCEARDQKLVLDFTLEIVHSVTDHKATGGTSPTSKQSTEESRPLSSVAKERMAVLVKVSIVGFWFDFHSQLSEASS